MTTSQRLKTLAHPVKLWEINPIAYFKYRQITQLSLPVWESNPGSPMKAVEVPILHGHSATRAGQEFI